MKDKQFEWVLDNAKNFLNENFKVVRMKIFEEHIRHLQKVSLNFEDFIFRVICYLKDLYFMGSKETLRTFAEKMIKGASERGLYGRRFYS